jgi:hypothetical protein
MPIISKRNISSVEDDNPSKPSKPPKPPKVYHPRKTATAKAIVSDGGMAVSSSSSVPEVNMNQDKTSSAAVVSTDASTARAPDPFTTSVSVATQSTTPALVSGNPAVIPASSGNAKKTVPVPSTPAGAIPASVHTSKRTSPRLAQRQHGIIPPEEIRALTTGYIFPKLSQAQVDAEKIRIPDAEKIRIPDAEMIRIPDASLTPPPLPPPSIPEIHTNEDENRKDKARKPSKKDTSKANVEKEKCNYTKDEDRLIAIGFAKETLDAINGSDQDIESLWKKIFIHFKKRFEFEKLDKSLGSFEGRKRTYQGIYNRWRKAIMPVCSKFVGCYNAAAKAANTGNLDEEEIIKAAQVLYQNQEGRAFNMLHVWDVNTCQSSVLRKIRMSLQLQMTMK